MTSPGQSLAREGFNVSACSEVTAEQTITKIKVMYLISDLSVGGAEMALYRLLNKTDRERYEPVVVTLVDQGCLRSSINALGIEIHTLKMKAGRPSLVGLLRLIRLLKKLQPHLIVGWMHHSCLAAELAMKFVRPQIPTIWSLHYAFTFSAAEKKQTLLVIRLCRYLSSLPARVVLVSHAAKGQLESMRYQTENSCVIHNGIDVQRFAPYIEARAALRAELGIPEDSAIVGSIGRYHPAKDHPNFLHAAASIGATHSAAHFVLAGRGVDNANDKLRHLITELHLNGRVHLLGERQDMAQLTAALDIFVLSSYEESCPNVIGEAMAAAVPCVATDVGDAALMIGNTGRVVPPRDSVALAEAVRELLQLGGDGRRILGESARNRIIELFTIESAVDKYEAVYRSAISNLEPYDVGVPSWPTRLVPESDNL